MDKVILVYTGCIFFQIFFSHVFCLSKIGCFDKRKLQKGTYIEKNGNVFTSYDCFKECGFIGPYAGTQKTVSKCWCLIAPPNASLAVNERFCNVSSTRPCSPATELCGGTAAEYIVVFRVDNLASLLLTYTPAATSTTSSAGLSTSQITTTTSSSKSTTTGQAFLLNQSTFSCGHGIFNKIKSTRETRHFLKAVITDNPIYCAVMCVRTVACRGFSLNKNTKECILHEKLDVMNTVSDNNWNFYMTC